MRAQLGLGAAQPAIELVIVSLADKGRERVLAHEGTELWPGDSIEAALDAIHVLGFLPNP